MVKNFLIVIALGLQLAGCSQRELSNNSDNNTMNKLWEIHSCKDLLEALDKHPISKNEDKNHLLRVVEKGPTRWSKAYALDVILLKELHGKRFPIGINNLFSPRLRSSFGPSVQIDVITGYCGSMPIDAYMAPIELDEITVNISFGLDTDDQLYTLCSGFQLRVRGEVTPDQLTDFFKGKIALQNHVVVTGILFPSIDGGNFYGLIDNHSGETNKN